MVPASSDPSVIADEEKFEDFWYGRTVPVDGATVDPPRRSRRFVAVLCVVAGLGVGFGVAMAGVGPTSATSPPPSLASLALTPTSEQPASTSQPTTSLAPELSLAPETEGQVEVVESTPGGALTEADFTYLGAFMAPADDVGNSTFAYGGRAAAFNPHGDRDNADDLPGSLFVTGHPIENPGVAEIAIPEPELHFGDTEGLPVADVLQPFADITDGRAMEFIGSRNVGGIDEFRYGGLEVVDGPTGPRLHWTAWQYYHVTDSDVPGHGHSSLDLANPEPQGPWFLDDYNMAETAGYLFTAPTTFADNHLDGHRLVSGFQADTSGARNSWGPPFFAYTAPDLAEPLTRLEALELVNYRYPKRQLRGHDPASLTPGADWVTASSGAEAIVVVGNENLSGVGQHHENGDCESNGAHSDSSYPDSPYAPRIMFYDPADLAAVASGDRQPWDVEPYRSWNPMDYLIPTCDWLLSSLAFDEQSRRMYVVQTQADVSQNIYAPVPVIHVFEVA